MQRIDYESLGDVLRGIMAESNMGVIVDEMKAIEVWKEILGADLAAKMGRPRVRNGVMTVVSRHAPLRHELMMQRAALIRAINSQLGKEVIKEIVFHNS